MVPRLVPLSDNLGVELQGVGGPVGLATKMMDERDGRLATLVADALKANLLVLVRRERERDKAYDDDDDDDDDDVVVRRRRRRELEPKLIRVVHEKTHMARYPDLGFEPPSPREGWTERNLRGGSFPGYPESQILGSCDVVVDMYGLSGSVEETSFWCENGGQWHHDGAFSPAAPIPPAIVGMTCEETPVGCPGTTVKVGDEEVQCAPGATLFFPTLLSLVDDEALKARARRMRCVYMEAFGRVLPPHFPVMSDTWLTPTSNSPIAASRDAPDGENQTYRGFWCKDVDVDFTYADKQKAFERGEARTDAEAARSYGRTLQESVLKVWGGGSADAMSKGNVYVHNLVQEDEDGGDYIVVHTVCLDHLEEWKDGAWAALSFEASQDFIEQLLSDPLKSMLTIGYRPGDMVLWDNLRTQHSVTARNVYAVDKARFRRIMTRTSFQPAKSLLV